MTGISELNFPAFNQEAERLRAEGLQVLNPADHGIVDGADWADYLRHDIAGLASCERIHLLRGWTKSKGACLEMTIAKALGMTVTYQVDAEMEHNNAPALPVAWWIPKAEQFCLAKPSGERPFAKAWEPLYAAAPAPVDLTDKAVNAAAKVLAERFDYPWEHMPEEGRKNMRVQARAVVEAALRAKGASDA